MHILYTYQDNHIHIEQIFGHSFPPKEQEDTYCDFADEGFEDYINYIFVGCFESFGGCLPGFRGVQSVELFCTSSQFSGDSGISRFSQNHGVDEINLVEKFQSVGVEIFKKRQLLECCWLLRISALTETASCCMPIKRRAVNIEPSSVDNSHSTAIGSVGNCYLVTAVVNIPECLCIQSVQ